MKGPLHAIRRKRSERSANATEAEPAAAPPTEARFGKDATEAPTEVQPAADASQAPPSADVPAGQESAPARPSFRERGRLRRRLRYLRRVRELGFRDLGGLVFDQHKFARVNEQLVQGKLAALTSVDGELRAIEHALQDRRPITELREPGISVCPRCGALHGSEARYCPSCGVPVHGALAIAEVGEAVRLSPGEAGPTAIPPSTPPPSTPPPTEQFTVQPEPPPSVRDLSDPAVRGVADPEPQPAVTEVGEQEAAKAAPDGEQPTKVVRPGDDDTANGAVPQTSAERRES
jgi:ribosomal protein L40E